MTVEEDCVFMIPVRVCSCFIRGFRCRDIGISSLHPVSDEIRELLGSILTSACSVQEQDEGDSSSINHHFVKQALRPLLALLLDQLFKQEEDQDKDDTLWNVSMAAGTCLGLIAAVVGDDVVTDVMQFVQVPPSPRASGGDVSTVLKMRLSHKLRSDF